MILRFLHYEVLLFLILRLVFEIMFKFLFLVFDFGLGFCIYVQCSLFTLLFILLFVGQKVTKSLRSSKNYTDGCIKFV